MWIKIGTIAGVIAAAATVVGLVLVRSNTNNGNQCSADRGGSVECYKDAIPPASERNEAKLIEDAKNYVGKPPVGVGPWPFVVVRDLEKGLKVRTNNLVSGTQIGALPHLNTAWAVCKQHSGFDPEGNGDSGTRSSGITSSRTRRNTSSPSRARWVSGGLTLTTLCR